ncbi:MAG: deoxynucleoside kinase [Bacilli bacterium]
MNIIVEGVDGSGKTTIIGEILKQLDKENYKTFYIKEIEDSPLKFLLERMLSEDPFFKGKEKFSTSIYETFILAADFFYKQEYYRNSIKSINIYDRDFLTILCYQKIILQNEYGDKINPFFENFTRCLLFNLKKIDLLIYIGVPSNISFKRVETRDEMILSKEEKKFLEDAKKNFEEVLLPSLEVNGINIIYIDGEKDLHNNVLRLVEVIKNEKVKC